MDVIKEDFERFSHLHSYYKHCPPTGTKMHLFLRKGQQPRNGVDPEVEDGEGFHWWFITSDFVKENNLLEDYYIYINCFTRGIESHYEGGRPYGWHIIEHKWKDLRLYLEDNYPEEMVTDAYKEYEEFPCWSHPIPAVTHIFETEHRKQLAEAKK